MGESERLPDDADERVVTIRLTRENLILGAALGFLGLAILLALLFPPGSSAPSVATSVAVGTAAGGIAVEPTDPARPATAVSGAAETPALPVETQPVVYPGPATSEPDASLPTTTVEGAITAAPLPTFDPIRPTAVTEGLPYPAPAEVQPTRTQLPSFPVSPTTESPPDVAPTEEPPSAQAPAPTPQPPPLTPPPTSEVTAASDGPAATARPARPSPTPAPRGELLRGSLRWTIDQSPYIIRRDVRLARGASLVIDPGVEVQLAPGVAFFVEGALLAAGQQDRPVRITGTESRRWDGLYGEPGGSIVLDHVELRGGGNGGTLLASAGGTLTIRSSRIVDNGGHIRASESRLEMRDTEISGNDMPFGAALDASFSRGGSATLVGNRVGGNRIAPGVPNVRLVNPSGDTLNLDLQGNLLIGQDGPNLTLVTNGRLNGSLLCNSLINGSNGLSLVSDATIIPDMSLAIRENAIEDHTPPIIPIYLENGIGRGATSDLALDMRENWWGSDLGPYEPDRNSEGRGDAPGDTIDFAPWRTERPACAPPRP